MIKTSVAFDFGDVRNVIFMGLGKPNVVILGVLCERLNF